MTSARVALLLHRRGITRVRPLAGGLEAWRERDFPLLPHGPEPIASTSLDKDPVPGAI